MDKDRIRSWQTAAEGSPVFSPLFCKRWRMNLIFVCCCAALFLAACGSSADPQSENYGNILASPEGLVLVQQEHRAGWMRADCFGCHDVNNIHQINRTGLPDDEVDLPGVRAIVNSGGEASCMMCHGTNGVPQ